MLKFKYQRTKISKIKSDAGFTLAEVLTVISIITILFSIVLANYRTGEKQFSLERSAHKLAQDLRDIQYMAMTGKEVPPQFGQGFPRGGYGIYFETNSNSYILFADCNGNSEYDTGDDPFSNCTASTESEPGIFPEKIEEISLESEIMISYLYPSSPVHITFFPPDPIITITSYVPAEEAQIRLNFGGNEKTIKINNIGLIDID